MPSPVTPFPASLTLIGVPQAVCVPEHAPPVLPGPWTRNWTYMYSMLPVVVSGVGPVGVPGYPAAALSQTVADSVAPPLVSARLSPVYWIDASSWEMVT